MNEPKPNEAIVAQDDRPSERDLKQTIEERRTAADADSEARSKLTAPVPDGYTVRCDDNEPGRTPPEITPALARSMLGAIASLTEHAGIKARADAELKDKVAEPKPPETKDDSQKADEGDEPSLGDVVKLLANGSDRLDSIGKRCDALEAKRGDDDGEEDGKLEALAADDAAAWRGSLRKRTALERADACEMSFSNENLFYEFQSRVDNVAGLYGLGHHAPKPMAGEALRAYKVRCLRPWQSLSKAFADVDLRVLAVADGAAFAVACADILKAADSDARHPTKVPDGWLSERVEQRGGHTYTRFYGRPKAWMGEFMPTGRRVKSVRQFASDGRIEGTLYQRG